MEFILWNWKMEESFIEKVLSRNKFSAPDRRGFKNRGGLNREKKEKADTYASAFALTFILTLKIILLLMVYIQLF